MYKLLIRPLLFLFDPEGVHLFVTRCFDVMASIAPIKSVLKWIYSYENHNLGRNLLGVDFPNPIGLAAGFDKNGEHTNSLSTLGFGFIEIGTVTPRPQIGNPKPRMFRLSSDKALINRMGFNNDGVEELKKRLQDKRKNFILGINIGKNKDTPQEKAVDDYLYCFNELHDLADYFVVNVSSPNTPNLRALQEKEPLKRILSALVNSNQNRKNQKPILLKIAPDLSNDQLDDIVEIVLELDLDGVIATNTTIERNNLNTSSSRISSIGQGGLSGKPLTKRSTEVIRYLFDNTNGQKVIIGVGGIFTAKDAIEKLNAGASLVQVYTGFIYEGPGMIKRILKGIANHNN